MNLSAPRRLLASALVLGLAVVLPTAAVAGKAAKVIAAAPVGVDGASVGRIIGEGLASDGAYDALEELCDRVGHRLSGSPALDKAIVWATARMKALGLANVHTEPVMVPVWVRGEERAELVAPYQRPLSILGLGMSVGTPPEGVTGELVVVGGFDELTALGEAGVKGRIVLFDVPFTGYGETVRYRGGGASAAAKLGATAVLVRSVGPISFDTPHTGSLGYRPDAPSIPAAAITIEDSTFLRRLSAKGEKLRVHLSMGAHQLADAPSANVVGEIVGREHPEEIVLLGAHLDSWDVGQGAQDDGIGVAITTGALGLIQRLGLAPRRTIRVVLYTNEENGLRGGKAYAEAHRAELAHHVAAIESDSGNGAAKGFTFSVSPPGAKEPAPGAPPAVPSDEEKAKQKALSDATSARLVKLAAWLEPLSATAIEPGHGGADIGALESAGVVTIGMNHDVTHYWDVHHTRADTFEKIDRHALRRNVTVMAVMAWAIAQAF